MRPGKLVLLLLVIAGIGGGLWASWRFWQSRGDQALQEKNAKPLDKFFSVKRGDLTIGILLSGSVDTKVKHKLALEVPLYNIKLVSIVDENTKVAKGDIVARFETESLQTKIDELKIDISNGEKNLELAREELAILISTNEADLKTARDNLDDAVSAYSKFRKLEGPKNKNAQNQNVSNAYQKFKEAEDAYSAAYDNYYNPTDVAKDENEKEKREKAYQAALKTLKSARISYRNSILDRKIFKRYTQPNSYKNAKDKVQRMKLALKKEQVRTQSTLAQKETTVHNAELQLRDKERMLEINLYYMTKMQLVAPVCGFATYGDTERSRRWGKTEIKVGMDVYRRQVLATIPDMSVMVVEVDIPEQYRSNVHTGALVILTPDSVQNLKIEGRLSKISQLPTLLLPWDPSSVKIYRSQVDFVTDDPRIVSGINMRAEIVSRHLKNVLYVPVEAVFEKNDRFFVYRKTLLRPEEVPVEIGLANDNYVEIKNGLAEGDVIYLYRPFQQDKSG